MDESCKSQRKNFNYHKIKQKYMKVYKITSLDKYAGCTEITSRKKLNHTIDLVLKAQRSVAKREPLDKVSKTLLRSFSVKTDESTGENLLIKLGSALKPVVLCPEDSFDVVLKAHEASYHGGFDRTLHAIDRRYVVHYTAIHSLLKLCNVCFHRGVSKETTCTNNVNSPSAKTGNQNQEIFNTQESREQSQESGEPKNGYLVFIDSITSIGNPQYIMVLKNYKTHFTHIRPLSSLTVAEVAMELLKIFTDYGPPQFLKSHTFFAGDESNFFVNVFEALKCIWPDIDTEYEQTSNVNQIIININEVKSCIKEWSIRNETTNWAVGSQVIQWRLNNFHQISQETPFKATFVNSELPNIDPLDLFPIFNKDSVKQLEYNNETIRKFCNGQDNTITGKMGIVDAFASLEISKAAEKQSETRTPTYRTGTPVELMNEPITENVKNMLNNNNSEITLPPYNISIDTIAKPTYEFITENVKNMLKNSEITLLPHNISIDTKVQLTYESISEKVRNILNDNNSKITLPPHDISADTKVESTTENVNNILNDYNSEIILPTHYICTDTKVEPTYESTTGNVSNMLNDNISEIILPTHNISEDTKVEPTYETTTENISNMLNDYTSEIILPTHNISENTKVEPTYESTSANVNNMLNTNNSEITLAPHNNCTDTVEPTHESKPENIENILNDNSSKITLMSIEINEGNEENVICFFCKMEVDDPIICQRCKKSVHKSCCKKLQIKQQLTNFCLVCLITIKKIMSSIKENS